MPAKQENEDRRLDHVAQTLSQPTVYSDPWWRGTGNNMSFGEVASKSFSVQQADGSVTNGVIHSQANAGLGNRGGVNGQDRQHLKQVSPSAAGAQLEPSTQMELVGHSIVLSSYPYSEAQYGGLLSSYGPQGMVPPQLYGIHHARMPLPLQMEEEPVYVNAKQYHGILRRRQIRAKAELENKLIKARKPYLHESRHLHAMRRARGCGGRFLNTKKLESNAANQTSEKGLNSSATLSAESGSFSGSEHASPQSNDVNSSGDQQEGKRLGIQNLHKAHDFYNGDTNSQGLSLMYHSSNDAVDEDYFGQQREAAQGNGATRRSLPF